MEWNNIGAVPWLWFVEQVNGILADLKLAPLQKDLSAETSVVGQNFLAAISGLKKKRRVVAIRRYNDILLKYCSAINDGSQLFHINNQPLSGGK